MSYERDEVKKIVLDKLTEAGYLYRTNYFIKGKFRDNKLPIALMDSIGRPCLVIRIRLRDPSRAKQKPSKRVEKWETISGNQVVTIWGRSDAENIINTIEEIFNT